MLLNEIFKGAPAINIEQLSSDSRMPMMDAIFFCISGFKYDGHDYIEEAVKNGAKVIVYSKDIERTSKAIYVKVKDVDNVLIEVAKRFYKEPSANMNTYVVSGCYGRSSVSTLIYQYLNSVTKAGYIGRFGIKYENTNLSLAFPTLPLIDNYRYISKMKDVGVTSVTFEASSSSLAYRKLDFIKPTCFVYTNSHTDSTDYKEAGSEYFNNMRRYLYSLEDQTKVVMNIDDKAYDELKDCVNNIITYGTSDDVLYQIKDIKFTRKSSSFVIKYKNTELKVDTPLLLKSNCMNLTAAIVALIESGYNVDNILNFFKNIDYIQGVFEVIDDEYHVVVDNSYTLNSLKEVLNYSKTIKSNNKLNVLFSISYWSDEDDFKELLTLANDICDHIILTIDENNDGDNFKLISHFDSLFYSSKTIIIEDREVAIETGINLLNKNDIFIITGKGSENYLITVDGRIPYDTDKSIALKYLTKRRKEENEVI